MLDTAPPKSDDQVREVSAAVEALLAAGKPMEAIRYAAEANRRLPCPELERQLMRWRMGVFDALPQSPGRAGWPPRYADPFPGLGELPVVQACELTTALIGGAIQHHGALWVRGLASPEEADEMRLGIDQAMAAHKTFCAGDEDAEPSPWYARVLDDPKTAAGRAFVENDGGIWTGDSPRMMTQLLDLLESKGIIGMIEEHLGERPALSLAKSTLRRVPPETRGGWHQDGAFLRRDVRTINVWLTLSPCGMDAPGLDVVARRIPYVVQTGSHGAALDWMVGPGMVDILAQGGNRVINPNFEAGDALLFDQVMLHQTGARPNMTRPRYALETWFFAPSTFPMERAPIVI